MSAYARKGNASDLDQLRRTASSIVLNLAEGYGHRQKGKKLERYRSMLGSAHEGNGALNVLVLTMPHPRAQKIIARGKVVCDNIAAMATNLIRIIEGRDQ